MSSIQGAISASSGPQQAGGHTHADEFPQFKLRISHRGVCYTCVSLTSVYIDQTKSESANNTRIFYSFPGGWEASLGKKQQYLRNDGESWRYGIRSWVPETTPPLLNSRRLSGIVALHTLLALSRGKEYSGPEWLWKVSNIIPLKNRMERCTNIRYFPLVQWLSNMSLRNNASLWWSFPQFLPLPHQKKVNFIREFTKRQNHQSEGLSFHSSHRSCSFNGDSHFLNRKRFWWGGLL